MINRVVTHGFFPEVVYGAEKSIEDLSKIMQNYVSHGKNVLVTKLQVKKASILLKEYSTATYDAQSGIFVLNELKEILILCPENSATQAYRAGFCPAVTKLEPISAVFSLQVGEIPS